MTNTTITDLASLKANSESLRAELRAVLAKYGVTDVVANMKIGSADLEIKIKSKIGGAENVLAAEKKRYEIYARAYGYPVDAFGKKFSFYGEVYRVAGFNPTRPKNDLKIDRVRDGKNLMCSGKSFFAAGREVA